MEPAKNKKVSPAKPHGNLNSFGAMLKPVKSLLQEKNTPIEIVEGCEEEKDPVSAQGGDSSGKVMKTRDDCQLIAPEVCPTHLKKKPPLNLSNVLKICSKLMHNIANGA